LTALGCRFRDHYHGVAVALGQNTVFASFRILSGFCGCDVDFNLESLRWKTDQIRFFDDLFGDRVVGR